MSLHHPVFCIFSSSNTHLQPPDCEPLECWTNVVFIPSTSLVLHPRRPIVNDAVHARCQQRLEPERLRGMVRLLSLFDKRKATLESPSTRCVWRGKSHLPDHQTGGKVTLPDHHHHHLHHHRHHHHHHRRHHHHHRGQTQSEARGALRRRGPGPEARRAQASALVQRPGPPPLDGLAAAAGGLASDGTPARRLNGSLVYWFNGSLVQRFDFFDGALAQWFAGLMVHWQICSMVHWFIGLVH